MTTAWAGKGVGPAVLRSYFDSKRDSRTATALRNFGGMRVLTDKLSEPARAVRS